MKPLPLRVRFILALIALALGTTAAAFLLTRHFLESSPRISVNPQMKQALDDALDLARDDYTRRKADLLDMGRHLAGSPGLRDAFRRRNAQSLDSVLDLWNLQTADVSFYALEDLPDYLSARLVEAPTILKDPELGNRLHLIVAVEGPSRPGSSTFDGNTPVIEGVVVVTESLVQLLNLEAAVQTYRHLQWEEESIYNRFLVAFLVGSIAIVLLASLVGVRIGVSVTAPLYALLKGTRELARDNLDYRIPPGREDEIGLLIESFNRMAEDLKENNRRRVEAEKIAAWREIARRLAHEIKNPLTPIQLTVQQMSDKYSGDDPAYRKLVTDCSEIVSEEVEKLRMLVQEFANFARLPLLSRELHNLNAIVQDVIRLYPDASLVLDLDDDLPDTDIDYEQMRRALINLIENGIEAAGKKAQIHIQTGAIEGAVTLSIRDSGPGIPEDQSETVFQPYYSTKESGMGLGLAVVRGIIDDHGGHIGLAAGPEAGAHFTIRLPTPSAGIVSNEPETSSEKSPASEGKER